MSYRQTSRRGSDNWGGSSQIMVAHKLMAVEVDWRREKETLLREIKRLRSEVSLMTKRCNNSRKEVHDMVKRLRTQPPPPIPQRPADIQEQNREGSGNVGIKDMKNEAKGQEEQEEQEKKSVPIPESTLDSVPKLEPGLEYTPKHEPEHHHSLPRHPPPVQSPTHTPLALEKQEERYRLSKERMAEFGAVIANGGGEAAVDTCAERWMLVWMKFCMHLAEDGKDGEAIYGEYKGEQKWDDQVIKWWNGKKDDLRNRNEMTFDENDMSELINVAEVDKIDRICWKMKFVKGFHINLEGNDIVLRVGEL